MTEADGVRAEVRAAIAKQEAAMGLLQMAKLAVDEMAGTVMLLGLRETGSRSNARPVLQMTEQTQTDIDQAMSDLVLVRADLNEWIERL